MASNHFEQLKALHKMEWEYERSEFRHITESVGVERMVARGMCWFPVTIGRNYYNALNQPVVEVFRSKDSEEEHGFEYGRQVNFFYEAYNGELKYKSFQATVSYVDENRMVIVLPGLGAVQDLSEQRAVGVQLSLDETSYRAMQEALADVSSARDSRLAYLRDVLCGEVKPGFRLLQPMRFPWLNSSQERAVNDVIACRDVMVVHGPPGTGKTTTLVEAIYETLHREPQVLVCAQSNTAVDWIAEKLADRGVAVLRIGNPTRVNDKMLSFTYERQFESHPMYPELWAIRKAIRDIQSTMRKKGNAEATKNRLHNLRRRADEIEIAINTSIFDSARVVASTLVSSNHRLLMGRRFPTLFIDEAGQALEAACWIAIRKADRVIFAGDHQQLPPTVKCFEAERKGLSKTLMERVIEHKPEAVKMLTVQYRMHKDIMQFSSDYFYGGRLTADESVAWRGILALDTPMQWIDTAEFDFEEHYVGVTHGRINKQEAEAFIGYLEDYVTLIGLERVLEESIDFGLISPYKAQVMYLRHIIKKSSVLRPIRHLISINTIDGFQGQERDVVFISVVRSNEAGDIGFLRDLRRMNVAITRARMKLVIVGNAATLTRHPFYAKLYNYIEGMKPVS